MRDVLTLILGGGRGARLFPLTRQRSEPAMPLAGKYRLTRRTGAEVTMAVLPVTREQARRLGVVRVDEGGRLVLLSEKPQTDEELDRVRTGPEGLAAHGIRAAGREFLGNMGIYLFTRDAFF